MKNQSYIGFYLLFLILFVGISCRKERTSWDSDWIVPFVNDSLVIRDQVNDSTLAINSDNSIQVIARRTIFELDLIDMIKILDTSFSKVHTVNIPVLQVQPGSTFIDDVKDYDFSIENAVLTEARVKSGTVKVEIENPVETKGIFSISLPGVSKNGVEFFETGILDSGTANNPGKGSVLIDFSGYIIDLSGKNGDKYNLLQSKLSVTSDPDGPVVSITQLDKFKTKISFENLSFDYGKGYFGNMEFAEEKELDVDFLNKIIGGALKTEDLNIGLIIKNGIVANGQARINSFESKNKNGNTVSLQHPYLEQVLNIDPAKGAWGNLEPSEKTISFTPATGNLSEFIENLGSKYKVDYVLKLNPWGNTSNGHNIVYPKSKIGIDFQADFPLKLGADHLILQDTFDLKFDNDSKLLRIKSGKISLKTENSFPFGAQVEMTLLNKEYEVLKTINSIGKISPAETDFTQHRHIPIEEKIEYVITEEIAEILPEAKFILIRAEFNSTHFNNNIVFDNAAFRFLLSGQFTLRTEI